MFISDGRNAGAMAPSCRRLAVKRRKPVTVSIKPLWLHLVSIHGRLQDRFLVDETNMGIFLSSRCRHAVNSSDQPTTQGMTARSLSSTVHGSPLPLDASLDSYSGTCLRLVLPSAFRGYKRPMERRQMVDSLCLASFRLRVARILPSMSPSSCPP